jgi:uncharacterized damage-inducible protein DinB
MRHETFFELWKSLRAESVTAVREFPADAFDEEVVPGFMTFRAIHRHILEAGHALTGLLLDGEEHFNAPEARKKFAQFLPVIAADAAPGEFAAALESKLDERISQLSAAPDEFWSREVTHFSGARVSVLEMLLLVRHHEGEHRAQASVLSRIKGIVPATTRRRLAASAPKA